MAHTKDNNWHGTLMLIAQPAEKTFSGARKMIDDGLFTRFPKPDIGVGLHHTNSMPVRQVGVTPEYAWANADSLQITALCRLLLLALKDRQKHCQSSAFVS
jgi:metal-dependent amidase/aminoacylase/carboxypeptidase family protein